MKQSHKLMIAACLVAALLYGLFEIYGVIAENRKDRNTAAIASRIAELCLGKEAPSADRDEITVLRSCIHDNTQHKIDAEFRANWRDEEKMARLALDYMEGRRSEKPKFECSTRSGLLLKVLASRGVESKSITIIKNESKFPDHVFLEVADPVTGKKRLEDPSFDLSFMKSSDTKFAAGLEDFLKQGKVLPCRDSDCGWDLPRADIGVVENLKDFPAAYRRELKKETSQLIYDIERFDPLKSSEGGTSYCDHKEKWCTNLTPLSD